MRLSYDESHVPKIKLAYFSILSAWANWQLINAVVDDVNKNTCMGGRFACCYVWLRRPSCQLLRALVGQLLADRLPGSRRFGKAFPCIWKGMLPAITLRNKENVSNDLETSWSGGRKHSNSCRILGISHWALFYQRNRFKIFNERTLKKDKVFQRYRLRQVESIYREWKC